MDISKFVGRRLFRFLAVGQSSRDLARYYDLARMIDPRTPRRVPEHLALGQGGL